MQTTAMHHCGICHMAFSDITHFYQHYLNHIHFSTDSFVNLKDQEHGIDLDRTSVNNSLYFDVQTSTPWDQKTCLLPLHGKENGSCTNENRTSSLPQSLVNDNGPSRNNTSSQLSSYMCGACRQPFPTMCAITLHLNKQSFYYNEEAKLCIPQTLSCSYYSNSDFFISIELHRNVETVEETKINLHNIDETSIQEESCNNVPVPASVNMSNISRVHLLDSTSTEHKKVLNAFELHHHLETETSSNLPIVCETESTKASDKLITINTFDISDLLCEDDHTMQPSQENLFDKIEAEMDEQKNMTISVAENISNHLAPSTTLVQGNTEKFVPDMYESVFETTVSKTDSYISEQTRKNPLNTIDYESSAHNICIKDIHRNTDEVTITTQAISNEQYFERDPVNIVNDRVNRVKEIVLVFPGVNHNNSDASLVNNDQLAHRIVQHGEQILIDEQEHEKQTSDILPQIDEKETQICGKVLQMHEKEPQIYNIVPNIHEKVPKICEKVLQIYEKEETCENKKMQQICDRIQAHRKEEQKHEQVQTCDKAHKVCENEIKHEKEKQKLDQIPRCENGQQACEKIQMYEKEQHTEYVKPCEKEQTLCENEQICEQFQTHEVEKFTCIKKEDGTCIDEGHDQVDLNETFKSSTNIGETDSSAQNSNYVKIELEYQMTEPIISSNIKQKFEDSDSEPDEVEETKEPVKRSRGRPRKSDNELKYPRKIKRQPGCVNDKKPKLDRNTTTECQHCGKMVIRHNLKNHIKACTMDRQFVCKWCGKKFATRGSLVGHEKCVHLKAKPYQCEICGTSFFVPSKLARHMKDHTGEKSFVCNICNKSFKHIEYLRKHEKIHTGNKDHVCSTCGKMFYSQWNLTEHELTHRDVKAFECSRCGKAFSTKRNLKKHQTVICEEDNLGVNYLPCDIKVITFAQDYDIS